MQVDRTKRWIAKWRKKDGSAIYRRYFAGDLHPNAWSDEISLKRTLIDQAKSYRLVCRLMKFIKKIIELFGVELKEFVGAQRANGFDKRRDTWKVAPSIISFFKNKWKKNKCSHCFWTVKRKGVVATLTSLTLGSPRPRPRSYPSRSRKMWKKKARNSFWSMLQLLITNRSEAGC